MAKVSKFFKRSWKKTKILFEYFPYLWGSLVRGVTIDSAPVLIVGCGHSGTSILLTILGAHSRICAVPHESMFAMQDNRPKANKKLRRFNRMAIAAGKRRWVEKTPKHILRIGRILEWCPDTKIILIMRDGRDVACSIKKRTGSLEEGVRRWQEDNLAGKKYWTNPNVHVMRYEDLVTDFEATISSIMAFIDEEYEPEMRDYHKSPKKWYSNVIAKPEAVSDGDMHNQYRNWQINQPVFDGRGSWKAMSDEELSFITSIA
jgi:hypothetical protein